MIASVEDTLGLPSPHELAKEEEGEESEQVNEETSRLAAGEGKGKERVGARRVCAVSEKIKWMSPPPPPPPPPHPHTHTHTHTEIVEHDVPPEDQPLVQRRTPFQFHPRDSGTRTRPADT